MAVDIPAFMDCLRHMALKRGLPATEPDVLQFHQTVLGSIQRYGRTHKLDIMMRFKMTTRRWLQDWQIGLKMLSKRKLDLLPSKVEQINAVRALFSKNRVDEINE